MSANSRPNDLPPAGYPETPTPAHGHPAYVVFAHLSNAITPVAGEGWMRLGQREAAARRALTVATWSTRQALCRAADAIADLAEPDGLHSPSEDLVFTMGFQAAQNQALEAIRTLEKHLVGGLKPDAVMLIPDAPDQAS